MSRSGSQIFLGTVLGVLFIVGMVIGSVLLNGCATKRWSEGDPREVTPLPTPTIIATVEIGIGVEATGNTLSGNTR
jgi:hypothetical protein